MDADRRSGVNTGFGGSADTRTDEVVALQSSLMQLTQVGILSPSAKGSRPDHAMPASWVRATMVTRLNATLRGHSAVSLPILKAISNLLEHRLTPVVPLRGSVSASGDLMPLSYISGAIEGNPDILIEKADGRVLPAPQALEEGELAAVALGPKEGLGLVNGTASSAALGALVMAEAQSLAVLTQVLTAMAVEVSFGFPHVRHSQPLADPTSLHRPSVVAPRASTPSSPRSVRTLGRLRQLATFCCSWTTRIWLATSMRPRIVVGKTSCRIGTRSAAHRSGSARS